MKVLSVVGARPQFVKLKPIVDVLADFGIEHRIVHTGQHYDANMSDSFFTGLGLPAPDVNLAVGSGSQAQQTGTMLIGLEPVIASVKPDWVLVYGDTNSTLAAALVSAKLGAPLAHVEAGLRSHNRAMPEEINRILTDHAANLLFAPTSLALVNLRNEGLGEKSFLVGDVMADLIRSTLDSDVFGRKETNQIPNEYIVATIHRPSNTDSPDRLRMIVKALASLRTPVILVAHPRLLSQATHHGLTLESENVRVINPLPYLSMLTLIKKSLGLITDSGGLQKEAFLLGVKCTTIRTETEWPETLMGGMNVLNHNLNNLDEITERETHRTSFSPFGDGAAAKKIVEQLLNLSPVRHA